MRILNLKELELVAGAIAYNQPVLTPEEMATMTPEQIADFDGYHNYLWQLSMSAGNAGDRMTDYEWIQKHGSGSW